MTTVEAITISISLGALLISAIALRRSEELSHAKLQKQEELAQYYMGLLLQHSLSFPVDPASAVKREENLKGLHIDLVKILESHGRDIVMCYPNLSESLNFLLVTSQKMVVNCDLKPEGVVDEVWLCRYFRDTYGSFVKISVERKYYRYRRESNGEDLVKFREKYLDELYKRFKKFSSYCIENGNAAIRKELAGEISKFS